MMEDKLKKINQYMICRVSALFLCLLCLMGCSGYIKTAVCTIKASNTIDLPVSTFKITQSAEIHTKYPNHSSPYFLKRFKVILGKKLLAKGLKNCDEPDIELRIVEFNLINRELESVKIEIHSKDRHLETMTYRPLDLGGGVSYYKWTPSINMASEKIATKIEYMFHLKKM